MQRVYRKSIPWLLCLAVVLQYPCAAQVSAQLTASNQARQNPAPLTIDILALGAKGDCHTDDSRAINLAIAKLEASEFHSGVVFFPPPAGGCYLIASPIVLSGQNPYIDENNYSHISLIGAGRGVSVIKAGTIMDAVLEKDEIWNRGHTVSDLSFDANGKANCAIWWRRGSEGRFTRVEGLNSLKADLCLDDHENFFSDSYFSNDTTFPDYNILLTIDASNPTVYPTDNEFTNNVLRNARIANIREGSGANHWLSNHGYNYGNGNPAPHYNFISNGGVWVANQADGSQEAGFLVLSPLGIITSNYIQGAQTHGICVAPEHAARRVIVANQVVFSASDTNQGNAIVQGSWNSDKTVSCDASTKNPGFGTNDVIQGNSPANNENIWNQIFPGPSATAGSDVPLIGIGMTDPQAPLDVNGEIRIGGKSVVCSEARAGTLRFDASTRQFLGCNGTVWVPLSNP